MEKKIIIGCCGYPVARQEYYKYFNCIEINITFYQLPELKTAFKWRREVEKNFEFVMKAWQLITHPPGSFTYRRLREKIPESKKKNYGFFKPTEEVYRAWERTKEFADALGCKKILFQCPASFKSTEENIENMKTFLNSITQKLNKSITLIWEPRGDWHDEQIKRLCKDLSLIHCVDPLSPFKKKPVYGKFNYFRLHGTYEGVRINYNHQFADRELKAVLEACDKSLNYVMFNNSTMLEDGVRFKKLVSAL
ncbi:MAG: DUF72 domain-containing protein [Elusimicrobiota bacterium]|nr:DUF72 domain-containing protein [Elusimicrobiota bacterium]